MGLLRSFRGRAAACALVCACGGASDPPWSVVAEGRPSALLSVWGANSQDVWVVGGDPRDGTGPIVLRYDGTTWTRLDTGERNTDLWWVFGFPAGPVFASGSDGTILRYQDGAFERLATPGNLVVFGLWGAAPDDLWAVGGNFGGGGGGFAWRYDGSTWTDVAAVPEDIRTGGTLWKVGGRNASDVWMSGTTGVTLHWTGSSLERMDVPVEASLLSIAGNAERFVTVGGSFDGVIYENDGGGWTSALPTGGATLTGVAVSAGDAYAVGQFGTVLRRGDDGWSTQTPRATDQNLHAAWIDPDGSAWAVGGHFDTPPMRDGVLIHKGDPLPGVVP